MTWPMGEILKGRRHEDEGKRVDGISKQAHETEDRMGDERNQKETHGRSRGSGKGANFNL